MLYLFYEFWIHSAKGGTLELDIKKDKFILSVTEGLLSLTKYQMLKNIGEMHCKKKLIFSKENTIQ